MQNKKILLLLFIVTVILSISVISATDTTNTTHINTTHSDKQLKSTQASSITLNDQEATCRYGGQICYDFDTHGVDEGKTTIYVNNTKIAEQEITEGSESYEWMDDESPLFNYPAGQYDIKVAYTVNGNTIESNKAVLNVLTKDTELKVTDYSLTSDNNIQVSMELYDESYDPVTAGNITASYQGQKIVSQEITNNTPVIKLPAKYSMKTVDYTYTDGGVYYTDASTSEVVNITVPGSGGNPTTIGINSAEFINGTDNSYNILLDILVEDENQERVTEGTIRVYNKTTLIAESTNPQTITIPSKYNLEELTFEYEGSGDYDDSTLTTSIYVPKITPSLYVPYLYGYKNSGANVYPTLSSKIPITEGTLDLYINGNLITSINPISHASYYVVEGNQTTLGYYLDLGSYQDGTYNVTAEYYGSNIFSDRTYQTTLSVQKLGTYIYAYNRTIYVNATTNLYAYIYSSNKANVNDGLLSFTIDDELIGTELVDNNTASIEYMIPSTLKVGKHTLVIDYLGTDLFNSTTRTVTLTVSKTSTTTSISSWTTDDDENIVLNTKVRAYNKTINEGNVVVYVDGKEVATSDVTNSAANITLPQTITTNTNYNLAIKYSGSSVFANSTYENTNYTFEKKNTTVRIYSYLRNNGTLTATGYIYSTNYAKVNKGIAQLYIDDVCVDTKNVTNNQASLSYNMYDYKGGNYTLKIVYNGTKLYNSSTNSTILTKTEYHQKTSMKLTNSTFYAKKSTTITINATLTSYSTSITEDIKAKLILKDTDENIIDTKTDLVFKNGTLSYNYKVPSTTGDYTFTVQSLNSTHFRESNANGTIKVGGAYTRLYQKNLWGYKLGNITFNTTIYDANSNVAITNTTGLIQIYSTNNTLVKEFTRNFTNGILSYNYQLNSNMTNNTYIVKITSTANDDYASSTRTANITLNNRRTYVKSNSPYSYIGSSITFNGTIYDGTLRTPIKTSTGTVSIKINNTLIAEKIAVKNGVYAYVYKTAVDPGKYNITVTYYGNNIYNTSTANANLTVNKNSLKIQTNSIHAKKGEDITINATITDYAGNTVTDTLKATISVNGKVIADDITVTGGKISYKYTATSNLSNNNITITVLESTNYKSRYATTKLTIDKDYQFIKVQSTLLTSSTGEKIVLTGNITNKYSKLITTDTTVNIKVAGNDITNITTATGVFTYTYTIPSSLSKGTYDITLKALENDNYLYNAKHMTLQVV